MDLNNFSRKGLVARILPGAKGGQATEYPTTWCLCMPIRSPMSPMEETTSIGRNLLSPSSEITATATLH